jgi:hypothetical protein
MREAEDHRKWSLKTFREAGSDGAHAYPKQGPKLHLQHQQKPNSHPPKKTNATRRKPFKILFPAEIFLNQGINYKMLLKAIKEELDKQKTLHVHVKRTELWFSVIPIKIQATFPVVVDKLILNLRGHKRNPE